MTFFNAFKLSSVISVVVLATITFSCGDDENETAPGPSITSFTPASGLPGSSVTISGKNFSTSPAANQVTFNSVLATVASASATQLVVTVPESATTGKIKVTTTAGSATSDTNFEILQTTITTFSPASAPVGSTVTITGTNFSGTPLGNSVEFNGVSATVLTATPTQLTVTVPVDATDGKISVKINGKTATTTSDFTIPEPTITSSFPVIGAPGTSIVIKGENFSPVAANNIVRFNGIEATVTAANGGELTVSVPNGATTGMLTVDVGQQSAHGSLDFEICTGHAEVVITNVVLSNVGSTSFTVSFTMTNVGEVDVDASVYIMQNYASQDDVYQVGDKAAGGYSLTSAPVLAPGESYTTNNYACNISAGGNTTDHPYLIMRVYDNGSVEECNEDNNTVAVLFN